MIKKKSYWILMLTAICILAVTGCKKEGKTADFHIYYTDSEGVSLVEKGIKPEGKTQKEQIDEILDKIQKNTDDIDYRSPFVKEVKEITPATSVPLWIQQRISIVEGQCSLKRQPMQAEAVCSSAS